MLGSWTTQHVKWSRCLLLPYEPFMGRQSSELSFHAGSYKALLKAEKNISKSVFCCRELQNKPRHSKELTLNHFDCEIKNNHCKQVKVPHSLLKTKDLHSLDLISTRNWMTHYSLEI